MYRMSKISKEAQKKCEIETIVKGQYFWLSRRDLQIESGYGNWAAIFDKCDPSIRFWQCERFVRNNLAKRKIRGRRLASEQFLEFKKKLGLDANEYSFDEQDIISALQVAFEGGNYAYSIPCSKQKTWLLTFWTQTWSRNWWIWSCRQILNTNKLGSEWSKKTWL